MLEAAFYLASAFWLGALHAATPGHGKTVAAAYLVGARGRIVDAITLGVIVTLAHTGGIVAFGIIGTASTSALLPRQIEGYLGVATGLLVVVLGLWMIWGQRGDLPWWPGRAARPEDNRNGRAQESHVVGQNPVHSVDHDAVNAPERHQPPVLTFGSRARSHELAVKPREQGHGFGDVLVSTTASHSHWPGGGQHHHDDRRFEAIVEQRPSFGLLVGLGLAGGVLPDPAALAVLLAAIANGTLVLGLMTVLVFSLGFASVLVVVGVVAARAGRVVLDRVSPRWTRYLALVTAVTVVVMGAVMTGSAVSTLAAMR